MKETTSQPRFTFNTVGLFTNDNKATVEFYTKAFGFTTSWDGVQPNVEMFLGNNRIIGTCLRGIRSIYDIESAKRRRTYHRFR